MLKETQEYFEEALASLRITQSDSSPAVSMLQEDFGLILLDHNVPNWAL